MNAKVLFDLFRWLLEATHVQPPASRDVLVVEDNANDAELLSMICVKRGYIPRVVTNLNSALINLKDRDWHRVFVDMNLGKPTSRAGITILEGVVFTEEAMKVVPGVKIVYVTGHASAMEGNSESVQFPCVVKGVDSARFDKAITATLASDDRPREIMQWKLFLFVILCCLVSALAGMMSERYQWIHFLNAVKP